MRALPITAAIVLFASAAQAAPSLSVTDAWSRPAVAGTNGVGYLTIGNSGKVADALVAVESPWAAKVEMHASSMAGGVMSMAKQDRVPVPAGGQAAFGPGGYHLMLIGMTRTTKAGDRIPATLTFASGARLSASFAVGTGAAPAAMGAMPGMPHQPRRSSF